LEVRSCGGGYPPVTERERDIHLNGTCGAIISKSPERFFRSGLFFSARTALGAESGSHSARDIERNVFCNLTYLIGQLAFTTLFKKTRGDAIWREAILAFMANLHMTRIAQLKIHR